MKKSHFFLRAFLLGIFLIGSLLAYSQPLMVKGIVRDEQGAPIPGATILEKGTNNGTVTNVDGNFEIKVQNANAVLEVSFIGYQQQAVPVDGKSMLDIAMHQDLKKINEVVVIGYGTVNKRDLTGSVGQVKAEDLSESPATSIDNLLKGRSAGLQVLSSSGEPGSGSTIRIRGNNSFTDNNPLYVVDGVPMGDAGNLKQINPDDIASVDVLKDASATAIYGSRGANGVIMITTKKGKANESVITVNSQLSWATLLKPFDLIFDPYLYAQLDNESRSNAGYPPLYVGAEQYGTYYPSLMEIASKQWKYKTYWPNVIYQTAQTKKTTVSARGGTDKTKYFISLGYLNQPGIVINNEYEKYTGNVKIDQKLSKNLDIGVNMNFSFINQRHSNAAGAQGRSPVFPVYDENGNYFSIGLQDYSNPVAVANEILNKEKNVDFFTTGYINWEIFSGLTFRSNLTVKYGESISDYYEPSTYGGSGYAYHGYGTIGNYEGISLISDNYLTYKKTFAEKHNFNIMAGTSYEKFTQRTSSLIGKDFTNDFLQNQNIDNATTKQVSNGSIQTMLLSYMGRVNYNYDQKYYVTFTMRADGSSKFGANNRFGYFPSVALAWNVNNESFFPQTDVWNLFKLRASYGITGNQAISPYQTLDRLGSSIYWMDGQWVTGYGPGIVYTSDSQSRKFYQGLANKGLKWETTAQYNVGTDLGFFNNRLRLTADYYSKKTTGLLRLVDVAISSGYHKQYQNDGEVTNKGYEFTLDGNIIQSHNFTWDASFNIAHNKNTVVNYDYHTATVDGVTYIVPSGNNSEFEQFRSPINYLTNGKPMNFFYGYRMDGIVQTRSEGLAAGMVGTMANPGEFKYVDVNGNGEIDAYDQVDLGNPEPKFFYGFNTNLKYKNFDMSVDLAGVYGNKVVNFQRLNQGSSKMKRWTVDNPTNDYPSLNSARAVYLSNWWIEDGSYLKLQNVTLGYTNDMASISWLKSLRIYVSCDNLWTFTKFSGYDPEVGLNGLYQGAGYPRPTTFTTGLNLTF